MQPLSDLERQSYTCEQIELELSKVDAFRQQMAKDDDINAASVAGFLGDFGIGNATEHSAARQSAADRESELLAVKSARGC